MPPTNADDEARREAGPELDALVAEHVMGWRPHVFGNCVNQMQPPDRPEQNGIPQVRTVPPYSTDIAAAWEVVDVLVRDDVFTSISFCGSSPEERWVCFLRLRGRTETFYAPTAQIAICRAAVRCAAVRAKQEKP